MAEEERIEIPLILENVLRYCLKDARERMEKGEELLPFSALAVGETLFMEEHALDTPDECFADARKTVEHARGAAAYGLCYDGFVETQFGSKDAILAQGGVPGEEYGHVIGLLYSTDSEGALKFHEEPIYVGNCLNYMAGLIEDVEEVEGDEAAAGGVDGEAGEAGEAGETGADDTADADA